MRAVLCHEWGEPEVLSIGEASEPLPGPGEVRIAVAACGVNFADVLIVAGTYQEKPALPFSPGMEVSGTVIDTGDGVTGFAPGDRVMAATGSGGFAEQAVANADDVFRLPVDMDFVTGAGFPIVYGTSYGAMAWRADLKPGETALVLGAAGGVGLTAVEVAKAMGATVIGAAGGPEKCAIAKAHGADHVIDYRAEDLRLRVKQITEGRGCDVIYDPVGGDSFDTALRCIAWEGRIIVIGFASGRVAQAPTNIILVKNCSVVGFYWGSYRKRDPARHRAAFDTLFDWFGQGMLKPHVSQTFPLDRTAEAIRLLADRKTTGKVVVTTGEG